MAAPIDPDAALHAADPGKFKPALAANAPPSNPTAEPGTLSDSVERLPDYSHVKPITAPIEHEQSWGEWIGSGWDHFSETTGATRKITAGDTGEGYNTALGKGYAPILDGLQLGPNENPAAFEDPYAGAVGTIVHGAIYGFSRTDQERRLADMIKARRAQDPKFMPGVPDDPVKLRAYAMAADTKARDEAQAKIAAAPNGLGTLAASLAGSGAGSFAAPENIIALPIGGGGKTLLQIVAREALLNGALTASELPGEMKVRAERGEAPLTATEAVTQVAGAAAAGSALGVVMHGAGKALAATGLPQKLGGVVGNLDLANSLSYKIYGAMPEPLKRKWGAAIVTKWAKRLEAGDKLEDVFSNLSNVELATLSKTVIGAEHMTPEERAAAEHLTRTEEVGDSSPYEPGPTGDATHESQLEGALNDIIADNPPQERPSAPARVPEAGAPAAPSPERPPAATSTADRRPLEPKVRPPSFPSHIYQGLKARGISDELAAGISAGVHAESRGDINAHGPVTAATHGDQAFGIGQWLGSRKQELFRRYGPSPSLDQQLDFLVYELKGGDAGGKSVLAAHNEVDALHRYIVDFMRPGAGPETTKDLARGMTALGRGGDELPTGELAGGGAPAIDEGPDPEIARLREEALQLDDQVIGTTAKPDGTLVNSYARRVRVSDLNIDADRFQFKHGGDEHGVTDRLRGVEQVDPLALGRLTLWEDHDGRLFVADGHQRAGLLKREAAATGGDRHVDVATLRASDGVTADDAMVMAALKNMGEDSGTLIDAAKIGRHNAEALERAAKRLPPKSALVRDGKALAKLSDEAFGAVYRGEIAPDHAAVIGHLLPDHPEKHGAIVELLRRLDPANRGQAESIVRQAMAAGMHRAEETDLFGTREVYQSLMLERAKVLEKVLGELRKSKLLFKTAAAKADTLEAVGSKIAKSASEKEAQAHAQALELVARLAFTHGPVADALNDAARKLAAGAKLADVADEAARAIRETDLGALAGTDRLDDSSGLVPDGAGRGGDAGEAGETVREEQPSLTDLERATERFSDPDGPAVKQQAESLEHDLKAELVERDAWEAERNSIHTVGLAGLLDGGEGGELGGFQWRKESDAEGEFFRIWKDGDEVHDIVADREFLLNQGFAQATSGKLEPAIAAELEPILKAAKPLVRRERIKAASKALDGGKPGEFRTVEPFPDQEPGYHRFRYVAKDGTAVGGNYTLDGGPPPFVEGFNVGDTNNPVKLRPTEVRAMFAEIRRQHPEATRVHAFRMTGARAATGDGPREIWIDLVGKSEGGVKPEDVDVHAGEAPDADPAPAAKGEAAAEPVLHGAEQVDPAIADRQRQEAALKAASPMQSTSEQLGTMGLSLFDGVDQPTLELHEEAKGLLDELAADDKAIASLKGCL